MRSLFVRSALPPTKTHRGKRRRQPPLLEALESRDLPSQLTWNPSASLPTPRGGVVAAPQSGIAVFGGGLRDVPAVLVSNPIWQATVSSLAPLDSAITSPGAAFLPDGTVLLFGGVSEGSASAVATKYDQTGNNTHTVASMHTARAQLGFATDGSNNVYAIGGVNASGTPLNSAESYNPGSGDWTSAGTLPQTLYAEAAAYDGAGHIFTFGGVGADGKVTSSVYEYTVSSGMWSTVATTLPVAVRDSAAVLASNGRIYVLGGITAAGTTADVESYDPVGNTWTTEAPLPAPLSDEGAASDGYGRIEILGGFDGTGTATANVWVSQELNQPDAAPVITTTPYTYNLKAGYAFSYQVLSTANPQASYALTSMPPGMTINSATGLITWTPTVSQTGAFSFTVEAMNAIGNSSQTATGNVILAPPTAPTGLTQTGETVSTATLSWTASYDPFYPIDHYVISSYVPHGHSGRGGGITYIITPVATTTTTTGTVTGLYSNFSGWFVVKAVNTNGVSSGYSYVYTLHTLPDTVPPTITVPADMTVTTTTPSGTAVPSAFTATGSDPGPGIDSISVTYAANGSAITSSYLFPLGPTTVTAYAHDLYGQYATGTFTVTVLNAVGPTLLLPSNQVAEATNPGGAQVPSTFTASAPDYSATDTLTYSVGSTTIDSSYDFPLGVTTVTATATDTTGATVSGTFTVTVKDTTAPTLTVPADLTVEATSPAGAPAPAAFTATATDAVTVNPTLVYYVGANVITPSYIFPFGTSYVAVVAADAAGNTISKAFNVKVVDTTPPTLTIPANQTVSPTSAAGSQDPGAFTATATDVGSQYPPIITYVAGPITIAPGYTFPLGVTTVLVQATDSWGNTSSGTFTVTVPPGPGLTLLVPSNQTVQAASAAGIQDAGAFTASTYDPSSTATIAYFVAGTPVSTSMLFPVGTTTVTVTASDSAGNSKRGSFTVTVQPPPVITPTPISWTPGVSLPVGLADATAYVPSSPDFASGIWLFGGATSAGASSSVYFLIPGDTSWTPALALNQGYVSAAVGETHNVGPLATDTDTVYKYSDDLFLYGGNNGTHATSGLVNYTDNPPIGTGQGSTVTGPPMSTARDALAYAADPLTGNLYAIGGLNSTGAALASGEVYNPNTDAWSAIAPLPQAIYGAVGLADGAGHVFVFGGDNSAGTPIATTYRYTIATNTWDTVASLPVATSNAAGVRGPDGNIYLLGGKTGSGVVANVLVYNPTANTWSMATPLPAPVYGATAAIDSNEAIEVIGGYNSAGQAQNTVLVSQNVPVPPPHLVITSPVPASISVSQYVSLNVALEDAGGNILSGNSDLLGVTVDGPDGVTPIATSTLQLLNGTALYVFSPSQVSNASGMYTVSFSDGTVQGASATFGLGVTQAIPTVTVTGGTFTYDGTGQAAKATALAPGGAAVSGTFSFTYNGSSSLPTQVGTYAVVASFTSRDSNYSGSVATGTLTITPTSPILSLQAGNVAYDGTAHAVTATALGVDGVTPVTGSLTIYYNGSLTAPSAPGTYAVEAIFNSSDPNNDYTGLIAMDTLTITPAHLVISAPASAVPGTPFNLTVSAQDSSGQVVTGFGGVVTLTSSAGADITPSSLLVLNGTTSIPVTLSTAGNQIITVTYPGLPSASLTILVVLDPPSAFRVSMPGPTTEQAGSGFLLAIQAVDASGNPVTSYTGPSTVTVTVSPTSAASNLPATVSIGPSGLGLFLANLPKAGSYAFSVISGATIAGAGPVTVLPGPAAKLSFAVQPTSTATGLTLPPLTVQMLDLYGNVVTTDSSDVVTLTAHGPGGFTAGSTTSAAVRGGVATFSNLSLAAPGSYTLSAEVPGQFTGPDSAAFSVQPLQVLPSSLVGTASGFSLQFNTTFLVNSMTPALYGSGFGATGVVPSVTLTQTADAAGNAVNNPVEGSLLLNTATNTITFLTTNTAYETNTGQPVLPDGTYTVHLAGSGATGFQALASGGGFLDGLGSGTPGSGDFAATFTVSSGGSDLVWAPSTADGLGQALNAPGKNQAGGGYPIYLSDSTSAVTDVLVTFNYDATLLKVTGVSGTGVTLLASSPGQLVLHYNGPPLAAGSQTPIGFIEATVPASTAASPTPYRAKDLLHLSNVLLNGGTIPVTTSDALHLVAYVGDADGNGGYSSNDAVLLTRVGLQSDSGFAAYPLVDPVIVGDTDGSGFIPADAALQINEAGVGFPTATLPSPAIPSGLVIQPIANNVDPTLTLGTGGQGQETSGTVTVAVNLDDAHPAGSTGLIEAHLALIYDPRQFTVSATDVHLGSLLEAGSGWQLVPTIDPVTGQIAIALSSMTPISAAVGGSLVTIDFHPYVGRIANPSSINLVGLVDVSGQVIATELEDAQGTFVLTPTPAAGIDRRLDSLVAASQPAVPAIVSASIEAAPTEVASSSKAEQGAPEAFAGESPAALVIGAAAASAQEPIALSAVEGETAQALPAAAAAFAVIVAPTSVGGLSAVPLTAIGSPLVSTAASGLPTSSGLALGQRLADPFFQALTRVTSQDAVAPLLLAPVSGDSGDGVNADDVSALWNTVLPSVTRHQHRGPRVTTPAEMPLQQGHADAVELDQYFAQTADEPIVDLGDE
jgi:N-acetylneuraminic acid mutarotase